MGRSARGYADALVAGGSFLQDDADAFKFELDRGLDIYIVYQTVFARKTLSESAKSNIEQGPGH